MSEQEARNFSKFRRVSVVNPSAGELHDIRADVILRFLRLADVAKGGDGAKSAFCGYSDSHICVNLRSFTPENFGAAVVSSTVAWHPFAVSFVAPGFHDWQRN